MVLIPKSLTQKVLDVLHAPNLKVCGKKQRAELWAEDHRSYNREIQSVRFGRRILFGNVLQE
jgi:hypothetical protein